MIKNQQGNVVRRRDLLLLRVVRQIEDVLGGVIDDGICEADARRSLRFVLNAHGIQAPEDVLDELDLSTQAIVELFGRIRSRKGAGVEILRRFIEPRSAGALAAAEKAVDEGDVSFRQRMDAVASQLFIFRREGIRYVLQCAGASQPQIEELAGLGSLEHLVALTPKALEATAVDEVPETSEPEAKGEAN